MFDFRYHALSLVAVFLALGIGIVLGVTIGDSLVSQADKDLRASLRGDVLEARAREREARRLLAERDRLIEIASPALAADRLRGRTVALLAFRALPAEVEASVREAVEVAGGRIDSVSQIEASPGPPELDAAAAGRFGAGSAGAGSAGDEGVRRFGRRLARRLIRGGPDAARLREAFPDRFRGDYRGARAVVYYREPGDEEQPRRPPGDGDQRMLAVLEEAALEGVREEKRTMVGVEQLETTPSQIPFYGAHGMSSVDSVDLVAGRVALAFALAGARGAFGFKPTAEAPLPPPPSRSARR